MGRPSTYSVEVADLICEQIADGLTLKKICAVAGMPDKATVFRWLDDPGFRDNYARARAAQADTMADEILEISDESARDVIVDPETGAERTDHEVVARSRLRVEARKWLASKMAPKKYGDRVLNEHTGANGAPIQMQVRLDAQEVYLRMLEESSPEV